MLGPAWATFVTQAFSLCPKTGGLSMRRHTLRVAIFAAFLIGSLAVSRAIADMDGMEMGDSSGSDTGALGQMGKHMTMSAHMTMTPARAPTSEDSARAAQILQTMRSELLKYQDYKVAEADGYRHYMETVPQ